jgi:hypothetical protein
MPVRLWRLVNWVQTVRRVESPHHGLVVNRSRPVRAPLWVPTQEVGSEFRMAVQGILI